MTTTITPVGTTDTITAFVAGYRATWPTKNILHGAMNARARTATVNGAALRNGHLTIVVATEADKTRAVEILNRSAVFQLSSSDLASIEMRFVMTGDVVEELDPETRKVWTVEFDLEEQA